MVFSLLKVFSPNMISLNKNKFLNENEFNAKEIQS